MNLAPTELVKDRVYFQAVCKMCGRGLRIRAEYAGQQIVCNHCGHRGLAVIPKGNGPGTASPPRPPGTSDGTEAVEIASLRERLKALEKELGGVGEELAARDSDHAFVVRQLQEARERLAEQQGRMQSLQEELAQARGRLRDDETVRQELESERTERNQLRIQVESLRRRADEAERLLEERRADGDESDRLRSALEERERSLAGLTSELEEVRRRWEIERDEFHSRSERIRHDHCAELDRFRVEIQEARSAGSRAAEAAEAKARELGAVCAERARLQEELRDLGSELDARGAEAEQLRQSMGQHEAVRAERDRLRDELEAARSELASHAAELERLGRLAGELDRIRAERDRLVAEQQDPAVAERLQLLLDERERSLAGLTSELEAARSRWEGEREEMQARWDRERQDLVDQAERRSGEVREQARVEVQGWQDRLDAASRRFERDLADLTGEVDRLRQVAGDRRPERGTALEPAAVVGPEREPSGAPLEATRTSSRKVEPHHQTERKPLAQAPAEDRRNGGWATSQRGSTPDLDHHDMFRSHQRRSVPLLLTMFGCLTLAILCAVPYLVLPMTWNTYAISMTIGLLGVIIFGYIEGRLIGSNPVRFTLQVALIGGVVVAAFLLAGRYLP